MFSQLWQRSAQLNPACGLAPRLAVLLEVALLSAALSILKFRDLGFARGQCSECLACPIYFLYAHSDWKLALPCSLPVYMTFIYEGSIYAVVLGEPVVCNIGVRFVHSPICSLWRQRELKAPSTNSGSHYEGSVFVATPNELYWRGKPAQASETLIS